MSGNTVAELEQKVAKLERQIDGMAEVVGGLIMDVYGARWDYEFEELLEWHDFEVPPEQNDGVEGEIVGWWTYAPNKTLREAVDA